MLASSKHSTKFIAAVLAVAEVLTISLAFDSATLNTNNLGTVGQLLSHASVLIQWLSVFAGAYLIVFLIEKPKGLLTRSNNHNDRTLPLLVCANLASFVVFFGLSSLIFGEQNSTSLPTPVLIALWLLFASTTALSLLRIAKPFSQVLTIIKANRATICICAVIATLVCASSLLSKNLWPALIYPTFISSEWLLSFLGPVISAPARLHLGIDDFVVHISSECSGIEGMGLAVSFTLLYLFMVRDSLKLPHALLLIPIAAGLSWLLNVVRITVLILLGEYVSEDFAIGGFHSQAGWFTFIALALAIIYCFDKIHWFRNKSAPEPITNSTHTKFDTAQAILVCFIVFLLGTLIAGLSEENVNWLYAAKALPAGAAILYFWRTLDISPPAHTAEAIGYGLLVLLLWVLMIPANTEYNSALAGDLASMSVGLQVLWLSIRFLGSIAVAPLVEELLFG